MKCSTDSMMLQDFLFLTGLRKECSKAISLKDQMNKEWFIFKGTHHLGPFSVEEMKELFTKGEINAQSLVWREGAEKWEALGKTRELDFRRFTDPALPPLPDLPDLPDDNLPPPVLPNVVKQTEKKVEKTVTEEPPPIPLDAILNPDGKNLSFGPKAASSKKFSKIIFASLVVIFAVVLGWFFMNEKSSAIQLRVKGLMPVYLERLQETATQKTPSISLAMALSLDGKTLFASTNKEGEILAIIKLKSLPMRVLGTEDVELMVRGLIKDHLGEFGKMQLTQGPQFIPGEYSVEFTGRKMHFLNMRFPFLNEYAFFKGLNTDYTYQTTALIYAGTPREFEKKLAEYKDTIVTEKLKPYTDKLERLQTFLSLLNKTVEEYLLILDSMKRSTEINTFESKYIKDISPIVQSMTIAAHELSKKMEEDTDESAVKDSMKVVSYGTQMLLGKQMGELASDMITETKKVKKMTAAEKSALKNKFEERYKYIKFQIDGHITKLEEEIKKVSN